MAPAALVSCYILAFVADVAAHRSESLEILQHEVAATNIADMLNSLVDKSGGELLGFGGILNCKFRDDDDADAHTYLSCQGPDDWTKASGELLKVLATVAASTGPAGAPAAVVLSCAATLVQMWDEDGGGLDLHNNIVTSLQDNLEDFHSQQDLDRAKARSITLKDRIAVIRRTDASDKCLPYIVSPWIDADREVWPVMTALLVAANSTIKKTTSDLGLDVLRRRVRLINDFKNLWSTMAMGRLELLTLVVDKSHACPHLQQQAMIQLTHTLLSDAVGRFREFIQAWEPLEAKILGHVENSEKQLAVAELRESLDYVWLWSKPSPETYWSVAKKLLRHGKVGRGVLKDLMIRKAAPWDRKSAVIVALMDEPSELLLPLAETFARVAAYRATDFPSKWQFVFPCVKVARSILKSLMKEHAEAVAAQGVQVDVSW